MADPREILAVSPMRWRQIVAVAICVLLNALDGFDVLSISFASPGIAAEWGVDRAALGVVLSMELIGMCGGSILLGNIADRWGRRPTTLLCLVLMGSGMGLAATAGDIYTLSAYRLLTGVGIGGMLACTNALVAEFSNARAKGVAVSVMAAGYPFGAIVGGSIASHLLAIGGWRDVFLFGMIATLIFIPIVLLFLPESIGFLVKQRKTDALDRVNKLLVRLRHASIEALPPAALDGPKSSFRELFAPGLARTTIALTAGYFMHITTFYFILKWIPKIVVDLGHAPSAAGGVLVWANVGGLAGALVISALQWRIAPRPLVIGAMLLSTLMVTLFGQTTTDIGSLALMAGLAGFCTNAGVVGLYSLFAQSFPTALRASGTGLVIGIGRGGSALAPILAGQLFQVGFGLPVVAAFMASGSLIGALALWKLRKPAGLP